MGFWWNEEKTNQKCIPSLDTGITNERTSISEDSIFSSENFKNISSMFDETELKIAKYKAQNRSNDDIATLLEMPYEEVFKKVRFMIAVYKQTFPEEVAKTNFRTINSRKGR